MSWKQNCIAYLIICSVILLTLTACRKADVNQNNITVPQQTAATPAEELLSWQDQYDLGIRYLSEGNYQEAIITFTAAIEIDPKRVEAYMGRADAYIGSGVTDENLAAAQADYEQVLTLDETYKEAYLGLAEIYIQRGEIDKALEILRHGVASTGDSSLAEAVADLEKEQEPIWSMELAPEQKEYVLELVALAEAGDREAVWDKIKTSTVPDFYCSAHVRAYAVWVEKNSKNGYISIKPESGEGRRFSVGEFFNADGSHAGYDYSYGTCPCENWKGNGPFTDISIIQEPDSYYGSYYGETTETGFLKDNYYHGTVTRITKGAWSGQAETITTEEYVYEDGFSQDPSYSTGYPRVWR